MIAEPLLLVIAGAVAGSVPTYLVERLKQTQARNAALEDLRRNTYADFIRFAANGRYAAIRCRDDLTADPHLRSAEDELARCYHVLSLVAGVKTLAVARELRVSVHELAGGARRQEAAPQFDARSEAVKRLRRAFRDAARAELHVDEG